MRKSKPSLDTALAMLREAAHGSERISGLTHRHYKYPARFSPRFVAAALEGFSTANDLVLDPYVGGGTTVVESIVRGRPVVGCDINSLALFVTRVKAAQLSRLESREVASWANNVLPRLSYRDCPDSLADAICESRTRNLHLPRARAIKKLIALAILTIEELSTERVQLFARCALLNAGQWALNGRRSAVSSSEFRSRISATALSMLEANNDLANQLSQFKAEPNVTLIHDSAENLSAHSVFRDGARADLVITSPPYPGIHILYHRWQVDGRRESPAPYWIAGCLDGEGSSYYNFGGRAQQGLHTYFENSLRTLRGVRQAMKSGGVMVQMVAFSDPDDQLPRYLQNMKQAGFSELISNENERIWRNVPGRSWHANLQGKTSSSRELVLVHEAE